MGRCAFAGEHLSEEIGFYSDQRVCAGYHFVQSRKLQELFCHHCPFLTIHDDQFIFLQANPPSLPERSFHLTEERRTNKIGMFIRT
jgi:hypothetical protein